MIKAIDKGSVHQICSGQVVLTLAVAIKELVENSLDAGATQVEVRLKSSGLKSIQVTDNGSGILEDDFQGLTLKHHTSKISDFCDLPDVTSFGFRGEALSSLCALSDLSIHTRHSTAAVGTRLEFTSSGAIRARSAAPRGQSGSTVQAANLFAPLPVRRREFERNAKRELGKAVQLLTAYCLVRPRVRFLLTNQQSETGTATTLISTDGRGSSIRDSLAAVFGPRTTSTLLKLAEDVAVTEEMREEFRVKSVAQGLSLQGWISSPVHGSGRSAPDRQFFFINGRPCNVNRLARLVNDVYHEFNRHQYPLVVIDIQMARNDVDVNVTPDKRSIFFDHEAYLLALAKVTLRSTFSQTEGSVAKIASVGPAGDCASPEEDFVSILKRRLSAATPPEPKQRRLSFPNLSAPQAMTSSASTVSKLKVFSTQKEPEKAANINETAVVAASSPEPSDKALPTIAPSGDKEVPMQLPESSVDQEKKTEAGGDPDAETAALLASMMEPGERCGQEEMGSEEAKEEEEEEEEETKVAEAVAEAAVAFSVRELRARLESGADAGKEAEIRGRKFLARICPEENEKAEMELQRNFRKEDFRSLQVIGQFNLGFIIASFDDDLFIIDQHATDEKFNFERLEREHQMKFQKLLSPMVLEFSASQEMTLLDNQGTFEKNGFRFEVKEDAPVGRRVCLISMPVSRNWTFGVEDIEEMIFIIEETGSNSCRPSKVRRMLASRACRTSVMIGTALTASEMTRLLQHMADMDQPWNCPHGRPTMRHLMNLQLARLVSSESG